MTDLRHAAEPPRGGVGDRLEAAIDRHADLPADIARGEQELESAPPERRHRLRRRVLWLAITAVSLYLVAPSLIDALSSWRQIQRLGVGSLAVMAGLQGAALACLWILQRIAVLGARWQPIIASQLAGNALAKIAPGGGAMGAALQYRMLVSTGLTEGTVVAGLTAANLLVFAVVLALPILSIPAILRGGVGHDLLNAAAVGLAVFLLLFIVAIAFVSLDRALLWLGRLIQKVRNRVRRRTEPLQRLPERLVEERDRIMGTLGSRWKGALTSAVARWALDFGSLLVALHALHALPRPGLALLAFCSAQLLTQVPITPGGLGFVEAGLTATLTLVGVPAGTAVVATFAYRLFSYWLQLPLGLLGLVLQRAPVKSSRTGSAAPGG